MHAATAHPENVQHSLRLLRAVLCAILASKIRYSAILLLSLQAKGLSACRHSFSLMPYHDTPFSITVVFTYYDMTFCYNDRLEFSFFSV